MEIGRTSRTQLAVVGVVTEPDGTKHKVAYSSGEQTDQIIVLVDPGLDPKRLVLASEGTFSCVLVNRVQQEELDILARLILAVSPVKAPLEEGEHPVPGSPEPNDHSLLWHQSRS